MIKKSILILFCTNLLFSCVHNRDSYHSKREISYKTLVATRYKPEIVISTIENDSKKTTMELSSSVIPGIKLKAELLKGEKADLLYITEARLFSNWNSGWTEGVYEASGQYQLLKSNKVTYTLKEIEPFELWDIVTGEIKYHNKFYRGDDGCRKVRNRVNRLEELSSVIKSDFDKPHLYSSLDKYTPRGNPFLEDLYQLLFPELKGFKNLERTGQLPELFYNKEFVPEVNKAFGINWRVDYSRAMFPENMQELRNSGTLYRDIEEAPALFYSIYNLELFMSDIILDRKFILQKY